MESQRLYLRKKFGKTFGSKEFLKYKDTLKKNDYKDCDLLCSKDITETGVYYVDYAELNKKGDYINYIMEYKIFRCRGKGISEGMCGRRV